MKLIKRKFVITEEQANKILSLSEQWPEPCTELATQLGGVSSANQQCCAKCATGSVAANDPCFQYCDYDCCDDNTTHGDDPCKDPETANPDECWICREPGAGCVTVANAGMTISSALAGGLNIYSDVNQCNQDEECAPIEPCSPPAGGCPQGTTWNQATCHCDPIHINDDPCNTFAQYNQSNPAWGMAICKACNNGTPNAYQAQYCECCKEQCQCCKVYDDGTSQPQSVEQQVMPGNCASLNDPTTGTVNCQPSPAGGGSIYCGNHTIPTQGNYLQKKKPRGERKVRRR